MKDRRLWRRQVNGNIEKTCNWNLKKDVEEESEIEDTAHET